MDSAGKLKGKTTRVGLWKCYQCRKPFTVKIGTIFEDSKVPIHKWLQAIYLVAGSKKGISSNQLHRILGATLKTAWFMSHRIREAMRDDSGFPLGGLFKRGMRGVYQHCSKKHLHRHLAEFDFRYSIRSATGIEDSERADIILRGIIGKRLTHETTRARAQCRRKSARKLRKSNAPGSRQRSKG